MMSIPYKSLAFESFKKFLNASGSLVKNMLRTGCRDYTQKVTLQAWLGPGEEPISSLEVEDF